ncbi:hypothetical protein [Variovorax sp.]|uniref:hypothetical protein n=1 Tax=Variovorax sp. TaxID=1871043 RepID=UPI0025F8D940|nr:hypothetical protein [Variovorax sp.]
MKIGIRTAPLRDSLGLGGARSAGNEFQERSLGASALLIAERSIAPSAGTGSTKVEHFHLLVGVVVIGFFSVNRIRQTAWRGLDAIAALQRVVRVHKTTCRCISRVTVAYRLAAKAEIVLEHEDRTGSRGRHAIEAAVCWQTLATEHFPLHHQPVLRVHAFVGREFVGVVQVHHAAVRPVTVSCTI